MTKVERLSIPPAREAVIIAAGWGSRLRSISECKPLTPLCGFSLLEIAVTQLASAGVRRVVVVTGYRAAEVEAALPAIADTNSVEVSAVRIDDWGKPNGYSVIAGGRECEGDYLLVMADHVLSSSILGGLSQAGLPDRGVTLAIDRRLESPLIDPDDATYVRLGANGWIDAIGKHLPTPHAVDCGAFLATGELAGAIEHAIHAGASGSLSDGMQVLANRGRAATLDIGDSWWIDVDDPKAHAQAEAGFPANMAHFSFQQGANPFEPLRAALR